MRYEYRDLTRMTKLTNRKVERRNLHCHQVLGIPYTVIDVGYWYQISFPTLPSGKVDYAQIIPVKSIHGDGTAPNMLTDLRDIGRFVARIVLDGRTLNRYIYAFGEVLSENEIYHIAEGVSGEKLEPTRVSQFSLSILLLLKSSGFLDIE